MAELEHNPGLALTWTPQEQATLEEELKRHSLEARVNNYALIANCLPDKTIRDVALRCRWMAEKNMGPFAKAPNSLARESGAIGNNNGITNNAIGGRIGDLLEQNSQAFEKVSANLNSSQLEENETLLSKARENLVTLLACMKDVTDGSNPMSPSEEPSEDETIAKVLLHFGSLNFKI